MAVLCPFLSAGLGVEGRCALWIAGKRGPGACAFARIARYLAAGLGKGRRDGEAEDDKGQGENGETQERKADDAKTAGE